MTTRPLDRASPQLGPSHADRYEQRGAPCTCGHQFGSGACLNAHATRRVAISPLEPPLHVHRWLQPVRGIMYCGDPTCDVTARVEVNEW